MHAKELDEATYDKIKGLCEDGDILAENGAFKEAVAKYNKAWNLVPDPKNEWSASTWILGAIADAGFLAGDGELALQALQSAMRCPGAIGNPFLHLRYGQVLLDGGEPERAADELIRAYALAREEIFEAEDPRYLAFLRTRAILQGASSGEPG